MRSNNSASGIQQRSPTYLVKIPVRPMEAQTKAAQSNKPRKKDTKTLKIVDSPGNLPQALTQGSKKPLLADAHSSHEGLVDVKILLDNPMFDDQEKRRETMGGDPMVFEVASLI